MCLVSSGQGSSLSPHAAPALGPGPGRSCEPRTRDVEIVSSSSPTLCPLAQNCNVVPELGCVSSERSHLKQHGSKQHECTIAKADRWLQEEKKFYHQFSIVKYSYLPTDTFRKYVERHVTQWKLALKFTGYCRQTSYTDSAVIHTLVPAVAWELQSQFPLGKMPFNRFSEGVCGKI